MYHTSNDSLVECYKQDFPYQEAPTVANEPIELEADMEVEEIIPAILTQLPALGIRDHHYVTVLADKLQSLIPRITVNLWDELKQRDQFREINAQIEHLEVANSQSKANNDVIAALENAGAAESGVRDIIREEIQRHEKIQQKQARKKSLAGTKTQAPRPSNGQNTPNPSNGTGGRGRQQQKQSRQQSSNASGRGSRTRGNSRSTQRKKKNGQEKEQETPPQRNHNARTHTQGRGRGGRGSQGNQGGANNAGRGRGGRRN
jgi:hypothetical protein